MTTLNCQQFEQAFCACKSSPTKKVSWRALSESLFSFYEIDDSYKDSIEKASQRFLRRKERMRKMRKYSFSREEDQGDLFVFEDCCQMSTTQEVYYKHLDELDSVQM